MQYNHVPVRFELLPNRTYLSLGSNMGERAANISRAVESLASRGIRMVRRSSLYETEPVDFLDQAWFLNCVIEAETELSPADLMQAILDVEASLGRVRRVPKGPRVIDVDILLYGEHVVHQTGLQIPHPRMAERRFVLVPLVEIAPDTQDPVSKKTAAQLLAMTTDRSEVRPYIARDSDAPQPSA